ncbi:hypothetical protein WK35_02025 [Burkholderia vietnamiensis]|jgi:hypothetical protein|uniref:phasin family protein n=1 Tax=Burkholderia cepacia complex TaxID=87882 RepID=UPI000761EC0A|nr:MULTISPECIES: phasin family protein [Burkholderia cepacia complex]KVS41302.1 hypothetical protein WK35_02025 [Burkholderia vietnamiensis]MBU9640061.1 phasin family protein [Burkholderia multivorans]PRE94851.1 hypothetical protein C6Q07_32805 [Burkholderia multivorans]PRG41489.1 hypothetical protein C6T68_05680 [Burkholderia multivorans]
MSEDLSHLPLELYRANAQLFQKLGELAQQASQQWHTQRQRAVVAALEQFDEDLKDILSAKDMPAYVAAQTRIARTHWEKCQRALQAAVQPGDKAPAALIAAQAEAFQEWQQHLAGIVVSASKVAPVFGTWTDYPNRLLQMWTGAPAAPEPKGNRNAK